MNPKSFRSTAGDKGLKNELLGFLYSHLKSIRNCPDENDFDLEVKNHLMDMLRALEAKESPYPEMNLEGYMIGAGDWLRKMLITAVDTDETVDLTTQIMDCALEVVEITDQLGF